MKNSIISILALAASISANAEISIPQIFGDNMMLQQKADAHIWGWATPGSEISIVPGWDDSIHNTRTDKSGRWDFYIPTPEASYSPYSITIKGDGSDIALKNVLVGEVWFCSGQSNMEMPLKGFWCQPVENAGRAIAYSGKYPGIRVATVARCGNYEPQNDVECIWQESKPENAGDFSAVAYFFARALTDILDVPVGVINCSLGGSKAEGWMPKWKLDTYPDFNVDKEKNTPDSILPLWERSNVMYNAMLHPVAGYTVKGFLWNQGEANVGRHDTYPARLSDMVGIWRDEWKHGELPFYFVEIPAWNYGNPEGSSAAMLREAQHKAAEIIPNSGCVSTTDLIYPHEINDIHGSKKEEIGERLAFLAAGRTYGIPGIDSGYPMFKSADFYGNKAIIHLDNIENGLTPNASLSGFEVAGADKVFYPARAKELWYNRAIEVSSDEVSDIKAVRYCFKNFSIGNIHSLKGLPLVPFRTDNWDE